MTSFLKRQFFSTNNGLRSLGTASGHLKNIKVQTSKKDISKPVNLATKIKNTADANELLKITRSLSKDSKVASGLFYLILKQLQSKLDLGILSHLKDIWTGRSEHSTYQVQSAYYSTFIHIYLNLDQYLMAKTLYFQTSDALSTTKDLPTIKLLNILLKYKDLDGICDVLEMVSLEDSSVITKATWIYYLSLAFGENHHRLVKTVYDHYLMKDLNSSKQFLETNISNYFQDKGLNDSMIFLMLQSLSSHGDVSRSLSLIEKFYFERLMITGQSLSKELAICVIEAYCFTDADDYHQLNPLEYKNYHDTSVERVLDVLGRIMERSDEILTYKDISHFLSNKFMNYRIYDKNADEEYNKKEIIHQQRGKEEMKRYNENLERFTQGNIMANLQNLQAFASKHIKYIQEKNYQCLTLFINCMLNHINLYQNFSGMVKLLSGLKDLNSNFVDEWLDQHLISIIINCIGNSNAKLSSLQIFKFMKKSNLQITEENYYGFISLSLRGDFHSQLAFYLYNYLQDFGSIGIRVNELLEELPSHLAPDIDSLVEVEPIITDHELQDFNRRYDYHLDSRDCDVIKNIFMV